MSQQQRRDWQQAKKRAKKAKDKYHCINVSLISILLKTVVDIMPCNTERQMIPVCTLSSDKSCARKAMCSQFWGF